MLDDLFTGDADQPALFEVEPDWKQLWRGMPSYDHENLQPAQSVMVHFAKIADREAFAKLVGQNITAQTKSIWYPQAEIFEAAKKVFITDHKPAPRYPVYIISKGRADSRLTSRAFEWIKVPYHIVIEPQEYEQYAAVIDPKKILVLPFSNLGLGGIPARNWVWEHSIATGAARHWIFDDNIDGFCRFTDNGKVEVNSAVTLCAIEDWVDRYENVMMAGFNYDYFAPRKQGAKIKPITMNTRVYSGILLHNSLTHRWRGRYNEDTDLSLQILKDGWCTALFNAFLMYKRPTLTMTGGNSDQLYAEAEAHTAAWEAHAGACSTCSRCVDGYTSSTLPCEEGVKILEKDGRWRMAEHLRAQHPEITSIERKWRRWQHQVDYRQFRSNKLILKPGVVLPEGTNEYGMRLVDNSPEIQVGFVPWNPQARNAATMFPTPVQQPAEPVAAAPPQPPAPAALAQPTPDAVDVFGLLTAPEVAPPSAPPAVPAAQLAPAVEAIAPAPAALSPGWASSAVELRAELYARGHRIMTRGDGKLLLSESSKLTDEDRARIKLHREYLLTVAEPAPEAVVVARPDPVLEPRPVIEIVSQTSFFESGGAQNLAQLLGSQTISQDRANWRPDEPPQLDGINEVVLNFATNGLNWYKGDRPVGVTVSTMDGGLVRFLPFKFDFGGNLDEEVVKRWARTELRGKKIRNANTRFDMHHSREWGVDLEELGCRFSDIQHTAALLDDHRKRFNLDQLAADYLPDLVKVARVDESVHHRNHAADVAEREKFTASLVWQLAKVLDPMIVEQDLGAVQKLEDSVIPAVVEMEKNGQPLDVELLHQYSAECVKRHEALLLEISREAGFAFDHTPKSWQRLFEKLGLPPTDSIAGDVITAIDHPLVKKGYLASQYASLHSKTFKVYEQLVDSNGILRFSINQLRGDDGGTVSGRFSIGYVQQVPNHDNHSAVFGEDLFPRRVFIAADGNERLGADAMQIEQRLLVHYANNPRIIAEYADDLNRLRRGEEPISYHRITWKMIQEYKPDMLYSHQKSFNFAFQYGAKEIKLAVMMGFITEEQGAEIKQAKRWNDPRLNSIKEIRNAYNKMFPEAETLLNRAAHLAKTKCDEYCKRSDKFHLKEKQGGEELPHRGYIKTYLGRRSRFPNNWKTYIALNRVLQGTGADIMKQKLVELHDARKDTGLILRLTVHDEVGGDATTPETKSKVSELLNRQSFPLKVPILWDCKTGKTWADCK